MDPDQAARLYLERIQARIPDFETMNEGDLNFIKLVNAGEKQIVNNVNFGYISGRKSPPVRLILYLKHCL